MELLTTEDAAKFLKLTPYTVRKRAAKGDYPGAAFKDKKVWRFIKGELEQLQQIKANRRAE